MSRESELHQKYPRGIEKSDMIAFQVTNQSDIEAIVSDILGVEKGAWETNKQRLTYEWLSANLPPCDLAQMVFTHGINYEYRKNVEYRSPIQQLFWKIENSAWRWGYKQLNWSEIVAFMRFLQDFEFGPGFEVTIDFTSGSNQKGRVWLQRKLNNGVYEGEITYIDGVIGLFIWHRGKHVMTIGLSPTADGLLVQQIQLANKKGNRWLYQLDEGYFEYTLRNIVQCASKHAIKVMLIKGDKAVSEIKKGYDFIEEDNVDGQASRNEFLKQQPRIVQFYDQPLTTLKRTALSNEWKTGFWLLRPRKQPESAIETTWQTHTAKPSTRKRPTPRTKMAIGSIAS